MLVTIKFNKRDDLSFVTVNAMLKACLTSDERVNSSFLGRTLTYASDRSMGDVLESWASEGFNPNEFDALSFDMKH